MPEVHRKQLDKSTEIEIAYISAMPQWYKFVIDYTDVQTAATTITITLATLPIKTWIHAIHWKGSGWNGFGSEGPTLLLDIGDEDDADRWLSALAIHTGGGGAGGAFEDGIGFIVWEPDFSNTHDLEAYFSISKPGAFDLDDLTAGTLTIWFLLSSMNL